MYIEWCLSMRRFRARYLNEQSSTYSNCPPKKDLLIVDSQANKFFPPIFNVLLLPADIIQHASNFVLPTDRYEIIALFIERNDLFDNDKPSKATPREIVNQLTELANPSLARAKKVEILVIPLRSNNFNRAKIYERSEKQFGNSDGKFRQNLVWKFSSSHCIYSQKRHLKEDNVYLVFGLSGIKSLFVLVVLRAY